MMQVCFFCGSANSPDAKVCHSCSQELAPVEEQSSEENSAPEVPEDECPFCGNNIEPGAEKCPHCQTILMSDDPLDRPAPKSHEVNITGRYDEFAGRVQKLRNGEITREQFSRWLDQIQRSLLNQRDRYVELIQTSGYYEYGSKEVDTGMTGILEFEEAMEMMKLFADNDETDFSVLDAALQKMWDGNEMCNEAMRINRDFRAKLEEDWGYM
ncbi:MAG: zinc ribbon domain-containing protein [Candidatus Eremiobacteraeota bacterium]|nr:zinc ribbon domain-containing protein [Candidatus Eremiobacteraeota bacterium]